jgi:hypothetical protein
MTLRMQRKNLQKFDILASFAPLTSQSAIYYNYYKELGGDANRYFYRHRDGI